MSTNKTMLTPDEAAEIARCSIKTVRRAYATGALTAYRRRGSRAILLDSADVLAWARGEVIQLAPASPVEGARLGPKEHAASGRAGQAMPASRPGGPARFDLSVAALRERRTTRTETFT